MANPDSHSDPHYPKGALAARAEAVGALGGSGGGGGGLVPCVREHSPPPEATGAMGGVLSQLHRCRGF